MLFFVILQFIISVAIAVFLARKVFEYDSTITKRNKIFLTSTALFFLIFAAFSYTLTPKVSKYFFMRDIDNAMMKNPMFVGIKDYDAKLYQSILDEASNSFDKGETKDDMFSNIYKITQNLLESKLPTADDDLIIDYTEFTMKKVKYFLSQNNESCFQVLFPNPEATIDTSIPQDLIDQEVVIFNKMLKKPKRDNKTLDEMEFINLVKPIYIKLEQSYPEELIILENPHNPNINKVKACELVVEMYTEIIKLPTEDAGSVLRTMLAFE